MKTMIAAFIMTLGLTLQAQAPVTKPVVESTSPSASERLAIQTIRSEFSQAWKDLADFANEVSTSHPGYHFNPDSGQIEKNPPAKVTEKVPEKTTEKPVDKTSEKK